MGLPHRSSKFAVKDSHAVFPVFTSVLHSESFWLIIALFSPLSPAEELLELSGEFQLSSITFCTRCLTYHQRWTRLSDSMFAVPERMKHDRTMGRRQSSCGVTKQTTLINYLYANVLKSSPSLYGHVREKTQSLVKARLYKILHAHTAADSLLSPQDHIILASPKGTADMEESLRELGGERWPSLHRWEYNFTCQ